jgi:hypothetical protein
VAKAPAEDAEGAGLVAEPAGNVGGGQTFDEVGAERLVLALLGVPWFEEERGFLGCDLIWCSNNVVALYSSRPSLQDYFRKIVKNEDK